MYNLIRAANINLCKKVNVRSKMRNQRLQSSLKLTCDDKKDPKKPSWMIWRQLSLYVALPVVLILTISNHYQKMDTMERLPFVPFEHLRKDTKRNPWNRKSTFFHNPDWNPLPRLGYEDEIEGDWSDRYDDD